MPEDVVVQQVEATVPSTNGHEQTSTATTGAPSSDLFALFKADTTVMVWLIFLTFGGGILALYYARVRYLPDIEWSAALIYLAVATILGGGIGILFAMSLFLPGFIWSEFLIFDPKLEGKFCYDATSKELCVSTIIRYLGKPFGVVLLVSHISLVIGQYTDSVWILLISYTVVSLILLALIRSRIRTNFKRLVLRSPNGERRAGSGTSIKRRREAKELARWNFKCVSWFLLSLVLSLISVLTLYVLSKPKNFGSFIALTLICTAGVLISNHVVAIRYHHHSKQAIVASLVAAGFLLLTADWFSPLSLRLMSYYGLGGGRTVDLLVTDSKTVEDLGFTVCRTRTLCNVEILSKLGDEYYLVAGGKTFTLPKTAVQSYESADPRLAK